MIHSSQDAHWKGENPKGLWMVFVKDVARGTRDVTAVVQSNAALALILDSFMAVIPSPWRQISITSLMVPTSE